MSSLLSKLGLLTLLLISSPVSTLAFASVTKSPSLPYEVTVVGNTAGTESLYLGLLEGDPHMYEFSIGVATTLSLAVRQPVQDEPYPFSLLLVRVLNDGRSLEEVTRTVNPLQFTKARDSELGLTFLISESIAETLEPGRYRLEISTSDNQGRYMLVFAGERVEVPGYFATLGNLSDTLSFFGYSGWRLLFTPAVFYPLGIILLGLLLLATWRWRDELAALRIKT